MDDIQKRITDLEERVKKLEGTLGSKDKDVLFEDIVKLIQGYDTISASFLQRRLAIGYARAARLLDQLETNGYIGKGEGAKPRRVLLKATNAS